MIKKINPSTTLGARKKIISLTTLFLFLLSYQNSFAQRTDKVIFQDPLKGPGGTGIGSVSELIAKFVDWIINLGIVAVVLAFIYVGFQFVAAQGNPEGIAKAKKASLWTVIGTLILIGSKVLTEIIKNTLTGSGVITG